MGSSGLKFKRCCFLRQAQSSEPERPAAASPHHAIDEHIIKRMLPWIRKTFGAAFNPNDAYPTEPDESQNLLFGTWCFYMYDPLGDGVTVADRFLEEMRARLSAEEQSWLEAQQHAWLSVWEVESIEPERGMHVVDKLSSERRFVHEISAGRVLTAGCHILARVVDFQGSAVFVGMHARFVGPVEGLDFVTLVRTALAEALRYPKRKALTSDQLRRAQVVRLLIEFWQDLLDLQDNPPPPVLHNTDGDPLLLTRDRFNLGTSSREDVLRALQSIAGLEADGDTGAERVFSVQRPGNAMHASWDNTVIGHLRLKPQQLIVETNSLRRADELRERVESALGALAKYQIREHADPTVALQNVKPGPPRASSEELPPEVLEQLRNLKTRQLESWLDAPVPAFGGKTPRAFARSAKGRATVDAHLKQMELAESRLPAAERVDIGKLRRELGLT